MIDCADIESVGEAERTMSRAKVVYAEKPWNGRVAYSLYLANEKSDRIEDVNEINHLHHITGNHTLLKFIQYLPTLVWGRQVKWEGPGVRTQRARHLLDLKSYPCLPRKATLRSLNSPVHRLSTDRRNIGFSSALASVEHPGKQRTRI